MGPIEGGKKCSKICSKNVQKKRKKVENVICGPPLFLNIFYVLNWQNSSFVIWNNIVIIGPWYVGSRILGQFVLASTLIVRHQKSIKKDRQTQDHVEERQGWLIKRNIINKLEKRETFKLMESDTIDCDIISQKF